VDLPCAAPGLVVGVRHVVHEFRVAAAVPDPVAKPEALDEGADPYDHVAVGEAGNGSVVCGRRANSAPDSMVNDVAGPQGGQLLGGESVPVQ
jgi:hypothetical protein